jgi:hypothetical protein
MKKMFESTKPGASGEDRKAEIKNWNLPILQFMYHGNPNTDLHCVISKAPAFQEYKCIVRKKVINCFNIDFNHIRQFQTGHKSAGISLDKGPMPPSGMFRAEWLDSEVKRTSLIEFMTMMPVSSTIHSYITQSSAYDHITLENYEHKHWPWVLKSQKNFDKFTKKFKIDFLEYDKFINHLIDINSSNIRKRIQNNFHGIRGWNYNFV